MVVNDGLYKQVGQRIREARERSHPKLSQDRLAKRLKLSRASIVNIEAGRQHAPLHLLWQISEVLGTDLAVLLPRHDQLLSATKPLKLDEDAIAEISSNPRTLRLVSSFVVRARSQVV